MAQKRIESKNFLDSVFSSIEKNRVQEILGYSFLRPEPELADNIDYNLLRTFNVGPWRGSFVDQLLHQTKMWARHALATAVFPKDSWYDLLAVIVKFLEAEPPNYTFKFKKPKEVNNARFGEQAEFYLNLALLSRQLPWLSLQNHGEITDMAFISALFYGPDLLKSCMGTTAVFNDLTSMLLQVTKSLYAKCSARGTCNLGETFGLHYCPSCCNCNGGWWLEWPSERGYGPGSLAASSSKSAASSTYQSPISWPSFLH